MGHEKTMMKWEKREKRERKN